MSDYIESTPWLVSFAKKVTYKYRLFCFPHAGGGAQVFAKWQNYVPSNVEVIGVSLPGREAHFNKMVNGDWSVLLRGLLENITPALDRPFFFFGHSLGARICYELAHQLYSRDEPRPKKIFVSSCCAPRIESLIEPIHKLSLDELIVCLREMGGVPKEVLKNRHIMKMFEPMLKADFKLAETWQGCRRKIDSPIIAMSGEQDNISPFHAMVPWGDFSSESFFNHQFPGGHFFLHNYPEQVLAFVKKQLCSASNKT